MLKAPAERHLLPSSKA